MKCRGKSSVALVCHPASRCGTVRRIDATVVRSAAAIAITYSLHGDLKRLCIAAPDAPRRAEGLWRHTCFEAFVAVTGSAAYREFNFAPSGQWAAYAFGAYRSGAPLHGEPEPQIAVHSTARRFELRAILPGNWLPPGAPARQLRLGLTAVIEETDGALSYWALDHPLDRPDFHHPGGFILELDGM